MRSVSETITNGNGIAAAAAAPPPPPPPPPPMPDFAELIAEDNKKTAASINNLFAELNKGFFLMFNV